MNYFVSMDFFKSDAVLLYSKAYEKGAKYFVSDKGYKVEVYVPNMYCVLKNTDVPIEHSKQTFNGNKFIKPYINGFKKGIEYFKSNHELNINALYNNAEQYVKDLHINYFHHDPVTNKKRGWCWWENNYPITFSEKHIEEYGYYAGIISELKKLQVKHAALFKDFRYKCELERPRNNNAIRNNI